MKETVKTDELVKVEGGAGRPHPHPSMDWRKVYSYLQEHKMELPDDLRTQFETFEDWYDPKFQLFVYENVKTNTVVYAAYQYGGTH